MNPVTVAVVGAGARGLAYAELIAARPHEGQVVAVAELDDAKRQSFADSFGLADDMVFDDWRELASRPRLASAVIIAVQDRLHHEVALRFIELGYDLLLEKPIATSMAEIEAIHEAAQRHGVTVSVCHVMRYTDYTRALRAELERGVIGSIVSIEHLEPIGYYHFAHSFVRGSWRRESDASFVLLAKSCHDLDWLDHLVDSQASRISSFGSLTHFRAEAAPVGSTERCVDCPLQQTCPYSAVRMYWDGFDNGGTRAYFTRVMAPEGTREAVEHALQEGPYGRCVYACDNDVNDHQVVAIEYANGVTVSFTLSAFTPVENRRTKIFGTHGQITGDGRRIEIFDFMTERTTVIDTSRDGSSAAEGHAGGDANLIRSFISALHEGRSADLDSSLAGSIESHRLVFAAERARTTGAVVTLGATSPTSAGPRAS